MRQASYYTDLKCHDCGAPLSAGVDTFGDMGDELCAHCYYARQDDVDENEIVKLEAELSDLEEKAMDLQDDLDRVNAEIAGVMEDIETLKLKGNQTRSAHHERAILSIVRRA